MRKIATLMLLGLLGTGCSNYKTVAAKYRNDEAVFKIRPIENAKTSSSKSFRIRSVTIDGLTMRGEPQFQKTKTFVLPLGVFNYWKHQTDYVLGKRQFKSPLEYEIKRAFEIGLTQFGYQIAEENPDFEITIKFRKLSPRSSYEKNGFFYFVLVAYGFRTGESRGPYRSHVAIDIETHEGGRTYTSEIEADAYLPLSMFRNDTDMEVERISRTLSLAINDAVAKYAVLAPR